MTVRHSLLAILDRGPCYGSQLRAEYTRRTGASVNVGQVYTTLERLARDGLVEHRGVDDDGRVLWGVTPAGADEARVWLHASSVGSERDETASRIALAVTLPGADVAGILNDQRAAVRAALDEVPASGASSVDAATAAIVAAARRARLEADVRWLDDVERLVARTEPFPLSDERPRRGRPVRSG